MQYIGQYFPFAYKIERTIMNKNLRYNNNIMSLDILQFQVYLIHSLIINILYLNEIHGKYTSPILDQDIGNCAD